MPWRYCLELAWAHVGSCFFPSCLADISQPLLLHRRAAWRSGWNKEKGMRKEMATEKPQNREKRSSFERSFCLGRIQKRKGKERRRGAIFVLEHPPQRVAQQVWGTAVIAGRASCLGSQIWRRAKGRLCSSWLSSTSLLLPLLITGRWAGEEKHFVQQAAWGKVSMGPTQCFWIFWTLAEGGSQLAKPSVSRLCWAICSHLP